MDAPTALVFPGQGAHGPGMLEPFRGAPSFSRHYHRVCDALGEDPLLAAEADPTFLDRNAVSSLLTVLGSVSCWELLREQTPELRPVALAGYSVGQWTALYAAGALGVDDLFAVVATRARYMDECVAAAEPTGMLAVIGLRAPDVEAVCAELAAAGELVQVSNYNAPGQYTLGGTLAGLELAEARLALLGPKRLVRVPVAGAWHSRVLEGAAAKLSDTLAGVALGAPEVPVIDNTTGDWLPEGGVERRAALARQVASPVLWMQGVRKLIEHGAQRLVEVGYGDVLTKFGFFVDRSIRHVAVAPPPRVRGAVKV